MKKFFALLIAALLLCAPLTCAQAKTVTGSETFTFPAQEIFDFQTELEHFALSSSLCDTRFGKGFISLQDLSITSKDDAVIDRVELMIDDYYDMITPNWQYIPFDHGTKDERISTDGPTCLNDVNSPSVQVLNSPGTACLSSVTVYYHMEVPNPPATGDTQNPILWLTFALVGAIGIVALTIHRRREF